MGRPLSPHSAQVIDLATVRQRHQARKCVIRLAPELDGLEMVYQLAANPDTLYGLPILAWGLRDDGDVVGLVPWMEGLSACSELDSRENGYFIGYRDPETDEIFDTPPEHKYAELVAAAEYFEYEASRDVTLIQQLPDTLGTHALCMNHPDSPWCMKPVFGWRLYSDGSVEALLADDEKAQMTPILLGDACLYDARSRHQTVYFFQRHIANRILEEDPATLEALAMMIVPGDEEEA
ncbi:MULTISPECIES: hypothetical protein [unclassified Halomonas]|uniref:hypothetical protein n=1 Tax=unclassified Halomonas TaxID=2609666 RepID=UPI00209CED3B|nr:MULTISPECIES: hypothetical protein [unclassified Halomonas]MCP1315870.1 hypothetical protein [Halomonas sp. 707D7]MCP1327884.1 hypothetical protein [Halomonas sp. 707D4]